MPYAFTQDVPIDADLYFRIKEGLGDAPADGLICHVAVALPGGGLRYIEVWETEGDWDRFAEERLHPVVHGLLAAVFGDDMPSEPERKPLEVIDTWIGT